MRGFIVRCRNDTWPMNTRPMMITMTPATRVMTSRYCCSRNPAVANTIENATKTTLKPSTKRRTPSSRRPRSRRLSAGRVREVAGH